MDINNLVAEYNDGSYNISEENKLNKDQNILRKGQITTLRNQKAMSQAVELGGKGAESIALTAGSAAKYAIKLNTKALAVSKAAKLSTEGTELSEMSSSTVGELAKPASKIADVADVSEITGEGLSTAGNLIGTVGKVAGTGGAIIGAGMGGYDIVSNIVSDVKNKKIGITGNNAQEKLATVGNELGGGLDALSLVAGPEFLLAGALVGGVSAILNWYGHKKEKQGVKDAKPPAPIIQHPPPPNFSRIGMVQQHNNNINQMVN